MFTCRLGFGLLPRVCISLGQALEVGSPAHRFVGSIGFLGLVHFIRSGHVFMQQLSDNGDAEDGPDAFRNVSESEIAG